MAASTAFTTYDVGGQREDLMDVVTQVNPLDTPMFSTFGKATAKSRYVEWMTETLATPTTNIHAEGETYSYSKPTARTRAGNYTQIFRKTFAITDTQESVEIAGIKSEFAHRLTNALKEIARDVEYAYINGTGNSGSDDTSTGDRELKGVGGWITTTNETGTGTGAEDLTETMFNDCMQSIKAQGGNPDMAFVNGFQKRQISAFTSNTRNIMAEDKKLVRPVDIYESDFGIVKVKYDWLMPTAEVWILQSDMWKTATLRPIARDNDVAKTGNFIPGVVEGELTLVALNEKSSGKITGLSTS